MLLFSILAATLATGPAGTIFVNFDGVELTKTAAFTDDDATTNTSWLYGGSFDAYGASPKRAAIMQALRSDWSRYDVVVTDVRPSSGDYTMAVVSPTSPEAPGIVGFAPVDCWDASTHANVTFAFHSADDDYSATATATTISQEVAHSFGLEHVDEPSDIMNPTNGGGDPRFSDACQPVLGHSFCGEQHAEFCPVGQQNAHAELTAMFGPAQGDTPAPAASIVAPVDGSSVEPGSTVVVELAVSSEVELGGLVLFHNGERVGQPTGNQPFRWTLSDVEFGMHELYVVAVDSAGNETSTAVVTLGAGVDPARVDGDGRRGRDVDSMSCTVGTRTPPPLGLALLVLGLVRRRR